MAIKALRARILPKIYMPPLVESLVEVRPTGNEARQ
jgi:hypothetical protein